MTDLTDIKSRLPYSGGPFLSFWLRSLGLGKRGHYGGYSKLVGNLFELKDLRAQDLKGISGPTRAWAALRPASVESRFDALHAIGLTDLVGREEELDLLLRRWSKAETGEGQVVLLSGEPGWSKVGPTP